MSTFKTQIGGTHYKGFAIDPARFCIENGLGFAEGSAVKYVCRWKLKGGLEDLRKAKHYIEMLLESNEPEPIKEDVKKLPKVIPEQTEEKYPSYKDHGKYFQPSKAWYVRGTRGGAFLWECSDDKHGGIWPSYYKAQDDFNREIGDTPWASEDAQDDTDYWPKV